MNFCTPLQQGLLLESIGSEGKLYIHHHLFAIAADKVDATAKAFQELIRRHDILRTSFHIVDETLIQVVHEDSTSRVETRSGETQGTLISQALKEEDDQPTLGPLLMWLLLYANDDVLFAHSAPTLQRALEAIQAFCEASGFMVNIGKTKIMQVSTNKPEFQPKFTYEGQEIEVVESFKY